MMKIQYPAKTRIIRLFIFVGLFLCFKPSNIKAQTHVYGGTAYVYVKNADGTKEVFNVVVKLEKTENAIKTSVTKHFEDKKSEGSVFTSPINFDIAKYTLKDGLKYSGKASVKFVTPEGKIEEREVETGCVNVESEVSYKQVLLTKLHFQKAYNWKFISEVKYDVKLCN